MERILPGFGDKCKGCANLLKKSDLKSGYPCNAAYRTNSDYLLYPKTTNDEVNGFNCESYKERWSVTSALANFVRNGADEIYWQFFIHANWP